MLRKIALSGVAAAFIAVAGLGAVSQPAQAGVSVHVGIPGVFGYWGPRYYAPYRAYPAYGGYPVYGGRYYARPYCRDVLRWKKVWTRKYGWVRKRVVRQRCW